MSGVTSSHFGKPAFEQMLAAIQICRVAGLDMPVLALTYTLIDAVAWAAYGGSIDGVKQRFLHFCTEHLIPKSQLNHDPLDLYAARCSILHTLGWESDLSKSGKAKCLFYSFGTDDPALTQSVLDLVAPGKFVGIKADELIAATQLVVKDIQELADSNPEMRERLQQANGRRYLTLETKQSEAFFGSLLDKFKPSNS